MSNSIAVTVAESQDAPPVATPPILPLQRYKWSVAAVWIAIAGAAYPTVFSLSVLGLEALLSLPEFIRGGGDLSIIVREIVSAGIMVLLYAVICGGIVGFFWATTVCIIVLPVSYMVARSLRVRVGFSMLMAFNGGAVGFIAVMPFVLILNNQTDWSLLNWTLPLGPGLTTILGQLGGALGGRREMRINSAVLPPEPESSARQSFQFGIRQLLWVGVGLSLFLTLLKLTGVRLELVGVIVAAWLICQSVTLCVGLLVATRVWPRWQAWRVQRRST
jgi:hypothetical protein